MKYIFVLGRNLDLSIAEVNAFFEREENLILNSSLVKNAFLVDLANPLKDNSIEKFGGVVAIGEIITSGSLAEIIKDLENVEIYFGEKNKFNYIVWDFSSKNFLIETYLKKRFKKEKLKAVQKTISGEMILQSGIKVPHISSRKLIDEEYFLFEKEKNNFFGKIIQRSDYEEIENRDMNKPFRRESLSISPRLAKIMINLSKVKKGEKLVDAFCGIGSILQEALIQGIEIIGIDKDKDAVSGAKENLEWAGFSKDKYTLINEDSKKVEINNVNVLVSEPDLGKVLNKIPTENQTKKTFNLYEELMINVLNNLKNKISGRIVFTSPLIKTLKKRLSCNIEKITSKTRLNLVKGFPIQEFRKDQIVGREIFVLEGNKP